MTKQLTEDIFTTAAFINEVWDPGNKQAIAILDRFKNRIDPVIRKRIIQQISNLELRSRWFNTKLTGSTLPRVYVSVARHFENQFKKTYPGFKDYQSTRQATKPVHIPHQKLTPLFQNCQL